MKTTDSVNRLPGNPGRSPMKITRRVAVASLLIITVAIVLGAPAPSSATGKVKGTQVALYPPAGSPSPNAIGSVTLEPYEYGGYMYAAAVSVSVSKLAPNASYYMPIMVLDPPLSGTTWEGRVYIYNIPIQTDPHGKGESRWSGVKRGYYNDGFRHFVYDYYITSQSFAVCDSSGTLVLTSVR